jgi:hypothetical protein
MVKKKQQEQVQRVRDRKTGEWYDPVKKLEELAGLTKNTAK